MRKHNVGVLCYPPHITHALQPADKAVFKSLKYHWGEAGRKWSHLTAGMRFPKQNFFFLFSEAWSKAATVENAQAGFWAAGMFPLNIAMIPFKKNYRASSVGCEESPGCKQMYRDQKDPKSEEGWIKCETCHAYYHESCSEEHGILDDDSFYCEQCFLKM